MTKLTINSDEQSEFEDWLTRTCPSGDAESVHRQWLGSDDYDALTKGCERENVEKLTIDDGILLFNDLLNDYKTTPDWENNDLNSAYKNLVGYIDEQLAEAYERGKKVWKKILMRLKN